MKSATTDVEQPSPEDSQQLSRFHPRTRPKDGTNEDSLPAGEGEARDEWIHTPSGPRRARSFSPVAKAPVAAIPKVDVPASEPRNPPQAPVDDPAASAPEPPRQPSNGSESLLSRHRKEALIVFALATSVVFVVGLILSFKFGNSAGRSAALRSTPSGSAVLPPQEFPESAGPQFDAALTLLRKGENLEALAELKKILDSHPDAPSIHYAMAIANMQSGYPREADRMADASIKRGFRVSDSWALKAAILSMQSRGPSPEQEALLKRAIAADPMNPNPHLELATLYRYRNQPEQARTLLDAAALRLNPADARMVIDTTLAILLVDQAAELPEPFPPSGIPSRDFPLAYAEMKRGNFESAAAILKFCSGSIAPDLFAYLVNDPAIRKFASKPELSGFY